MDSLVPFDLNLIPHVPVSLSDRSGATQAVRPKLTPKEEPLDDVSHQTPTLEAASNLFPSSPIVFPDSVDSGFVDELRRIDASQDDDVYSEFARVNQLFRSAFGQSGSQPDAASGSRTGALVPVPANVSLAVPNYKRVKRSSDLVRVTNLSDEDRKHYRGLVRRTRMLFDSLRVFHVYDEEKREAFGEGHRARGDLRAAVVMRERGLWLNRDKRIVGSIPGVLVGDVFFHRIELCVIGLHGQTQAGIDYLTSSESSNGEPIATSVIVSGGYEDDEDNGNVIIYTGQGGRDKVNKQCANQKMESGNLALERSKHYGIEIRVVRGFKYPGSLTSKVYVYDGLYQAVDSWFDVGKSGFGVFKFRLVRLAGQAQMGTGLLKDALTLRIRPLVLRPKGYITLDLAEKKEKANIFVFNDIDSDNEPLRYLYLPRSGLPSILGESPGIIAGCSCVAGCSDDCLCAMKNGGGIPYDQYGFLLRGKPVIFECGPSCSCPPECRNRMSQRGLRHRLEVFRSRETGWGVRTLDLINAGSFICEYAGVVIPSGMTQLLGMNGDCLLYPGRFAPRWTEWGDLTQVFPAYPQPTTPSLPPLDFAMDVSTLRNVACYIGHNSISPNVMAQFVLYDHNNLAFPHVMLFAMESIPPMKELSIDYGVADEYTGKLSMRKS